MQTDDSPAVRAIVVTLQRISAKLPGAEQYVMVHHPAFRVGKKPFAIAGMLQGRDDATVSVNLGHEMQHELLSDPRFSKTRYIGQHGWVLALPKDLQKGELESLVIESWRRVANKKQLAAYDGVGAAAKSNPARAPTKKAPAKKAAAKKAAAKK